MPTVNLPVRVLITGATGQVGRALGASVPQGIEARLTARSDLDVGDADQVTEYITEYRPDLIINAAAYTAVDKAESDEATATRCNAHAPLNLARAASMIGSVRVIHISTDFVFDGRASSPYEPDDQVAPLGVYGRSKLAGEHAVLETLGDSGLVVRTAWVYAAQGQNFLRTMLRLLKERGSVRVVDDQIGTPTAAQSLAEILWKFAARPELSGVFHWTDAGVASWYDFAVAIAEEALVRGLLEREGAVTPIPSREYPTAAKRPAFSVLDKRSTIAALGIKPVHWRSRLRNVMEELVVA